MPSSLMIAFIGLLYLFGFGVLSYVRQQGLSIRFVIEGLIITAAGAIVTSAFPVSPILFLIVIYLVTMRVRLLTDLANWFTARRDYRRALALYEFALRLWPDATGQLIALINRGVTELSRQENDAAYHILEEALSGERGGLIGVKKYLAAGYYNLGIACRRTGREAEAIQHFNQAMDALPSSIYARAAERALKERLSGKR